MRADPGAIQGSDGQPRPDGFGTKPAIITPENYGKINQGCLHGFAFDRALEAITMHPAIWPLVKEFTGVTFSTDF